MVNSPDQSSGSIGRAAQRQQVPAEVYPYRAGIIGGFLGGVAMAVVAAATVPLIGRGFWFPLNLVAATVLRDLQNASPEVLGQFMPLAFVVGVILHLFLSTVIGSLFALLLPTLPGPAFVWSLITGPLLWVIVEFVVLPLANPIMSQYVNTLSFIIAHLAYSLVLGWWVIRYPKIPVG